MMTTPAYTIQTTDCGENVWAPTVGNTADTALIEYVQSSVMRTREFWPETHSDELDALLSWRRMDAIDIAKLSNEAARVVKQIKFATPSESFGVMMRAAFYDAVAVMELRLTNLLGAVMYADTDGDRAWEGTTE